MVKLSQTEQHTSTVVIKNLPLATGIDEIKALIKSVSYYITECGGSILKEKGSVFLPLESFPEDPSLNHTRGFGFIKLQNNKNVLKLLETVKDKTNQNMLSLITGTTYKVKIERASSSKKKTREEMIELSMNR